MLIPIITFIAFLVLFAYIMVYRWAILNEFSNTDLIILLATIVLFASVVHYKDKAENCKNPCPEYKKIEVYVPK